MALARIRSLGLLGLAAAGLAGAVSMNGAQAQIFPQEASPALNYTIHCSGCHKSDGSGEINIVPDIRHQVARYLAVPGGREYLVQVPGSSNSFLSDKDLAKLLNYMVREFDPSHVPARFKPYSEAEVTHLRATPLSEALSVRASLLAELDRRGLK
ncbi:cytochrome C [Novosphingobium sp.]|uniref:c-type cytochrome n=1 Tax=Novosphingobium sp. TaxID=1874826 RepID=UPI002603EB41|nr:cytochrome C [Novosphingobium sp.]